MPWILSCFPQGRLTGLGPLVQNVRLKSVCLYIWHTKQSQWHFSQGWESVQISTGIWSLCITECSLGIYVVLYGDFMVL